MDKLPEIKYSLVNRFLSSIQMRELLKEGPHCLTADGEPVCLVMSIESYQALLPVNPNPPRQPKMVRVEGVLYREVV